MSERPLILTDRHGPTLAVDVTAWEGRAAIRAHAGEALPGPYRWNDCDGSMIATEPPAYWPTDADDMVWPIYVVKVETPPGYEPDWWGPRLDRHFDFAHKRHLENLASETAQFLTMAATNILPALDEIDRLTELLKQAKAGRGET